MFNMTNTAMSSLNTTLNTTLFSTNHNPLSFFFKHIYLLLLFIVGTIGNGFVIIVFGQRALRTAIGSTGSNMSVYPFLFYMAISDTIYLLILFCLWLSNYSNILHRPVICQLTLYLTYVCNFVSAYFTVSFTAQRLFAVVKPFRVSYVLSWYRSRCLTLLIVLIACLIYLYLPFLVGIVNGQCYSLEHLRWLNRLMDIVDSIIVFLIPYIAIIIMNTIIIFTLRHMKQNQNELLFRNSSNLNNIHEVTRRNASRKMTKLLLTVSTLYLIVCAPYACIHTWRLLFIKEQFQKQFLQRLERNFHLIYHISFAMNFYIYIMFDSKFRRELKRLFIKCKINAEHYFRQPNIPDDESLNCHNSSLGFRHIQLTDQSSPCLTVTTNDISFKYRCKQFKGHYR